MGRALVVVLLVIGCGSPDPPDTDAELRQWFAAHRAAFEAARDRLVADPQAPVDRAATGALKIQASREGIEFVMVTRGIIPSGLLRAIVWMPGGPPAGELIVYDVDLMSTPHGVQYSLLDGDWYLVAVWN